MFSGHTLKRVRQILRLIYSKDHADVFLRRLTNLMDLYRREEVITEKRKKYENVSVLSEKDAFLITYADTITREGEKPLRTLHRFLRTHVKDRVTGIHILPFFPSSSDGGYAVVNYKDVEPVFGSWEDVRNISEDYRLIFDLVLNHVSSRSPWFKAFLRGDRRYRDYFIWSDKRMAMPKVFRPRETPLFTAFDTRGGKKYLWTTFGPDQIDLNYKSPDVLMRIIDVLLFYLTKGAEVIRLDAIGYIWKEPNTRCVNLSKTHQIVRLFRLVLEYVAPYALILTEANFPYKENIAYFGEGHEAHMVYNFSLPPLVLDAFARRDTTYLQAVTERTRQDLLFLDFLASHDGIGLPGAKEVLDEEDFENLLRVTKDHGGLISQKASNGKKVPYELNITYFDAINDPKRPDDPFAVKRFLASQAIMLALKGVPDIYIHSLLGSRNNHDGVSQSGVKRMINREKLTEKRVEASLSDVRSLTHQVFEQFVRLLKARETIRPFHPSSTRKVIASDRRLLVVERRFEGESVSVVINVSEDHVELPVYRGKANTVTGGRFPGKAEPYGVYFLR